MRYALVLLAGILLGGGAAIFFLGAPPAKSAPGAAIRPPDQGAPPPATVVVSLEQSFIDAVLSTTFTGLGTPTFNLGRNGGASVEEITPALFQGGCQRLHNEAVGFLGSGFAHCRAAGTERKHRPMNSRGVAP